jgi:hypothetical protein
LHVFDEIIHVLLNTSSARLWRTQAYGNSLNNAAIGITELFRRALMNTVS